MKLIIPQKPKVQKRPRVTRWGTYDPSAPDKEETRLLLLKDIAKLKSFSTELDTSPLSIKLIAYMQIPKSLSKKKQAELDGTYHTKKPDWDNIYKFYTDLLEGIVYVNDSQLCVTSGAKIYSTNPRVEIEINKAPIISA